MIGEFEDSLKYFRTRYFRDGGHTPEYRHLHLRNNDSPELVSQVLQGVNDSPPDVIGALLIIVYRLRNNLFHGVKWAYGIRGQRENFRKASAALMVAYAQMAKDDA